MCVFVHRQASLNEAVERYYGKAADLRPNVSTFFSYSITCMHLADTFIQSDLQCIQVIHFLSVCVFPGD